MTDLKKLIHGAKLRTTTFPICLDPDLVDEYERLLDEEERAADEDARAIESGSASLGGRSPKVDLSEALDDCEERMRDNTLTLVLTALPNPDFQAMLDRHPPRRDDAGNVPHADRLGYNDSTFYAELVPASITGPDLDADDIDVLLRQKLSHRQWQELTTAAWNLNRTTVDIPFSRAGSPNRRRSSAK